MAESGDQVLNYSAVFLRTFCKPPERREYMLQTVVMYDRHTGQPHLKSSGRVERMLHIQ